MSPHAEHQLPDNPRLVLVTGAGRSGTSTIAGALSRLGFHVPQPVLQPNESNPRGFYESSWPVRFHNKLLARAGMTPTDARPDAADLMAATVDDRARASLHTWLSAQFDASALVMVKDPRAAWIPELWSTEVEELGAEISYLTMLRHPTEVIGSRKTHYTTTDESPAVMHAFAIRHLCGWLNQNLILEHRDRGQRRTFIRYPDLLADWRPVLTKALADLGLPSELVTADAADEIDAFIEPSLRRHHTDWERFQVPAPLVELAEDAWAGLSALADSNGHDADAEQALDLAAGRYRQLFNDAVAMTSDHAADLARRSLKKGRRQGRREVKTQWELARQRRPLPRVKRKLGRLWRRWKPGAERPAAESPGRT